MNANLQNQLQEQRSNDIQNVSLSTTNEPQLVSQPCWDTIHLRLLAEQVPNISLLEEIPSRLAENERFTCTSKYGSSWHAKHNNLNIIVTGKSVTIKGSISKWYMGNNLHSITLADTQNVLGQLSELIGLPIELFCIDRVDLAANLIMENPAEAYFPHLGIIEKGNVLPRHEPSGIYYDLPSKPLNKSSLLFYSKDKEMRAHRKRIPVEWMGLHVLRYEYRKYPLLMTADSLYKKEFYDGLLEQWKGRYDEITMQNDVILNLGEIHGKKDFSKLGILALCQLVGGFNKAIEQVEQARVMGKLTSKQAYDFRKALIQANEADGQLTVTSPLIEELNKKIYIAYRNGKQLLD